MNIDNYSKNGYLIINNIITKKNCNKILNIIKKLKKNKKDITDNDHPFSKIKSDKKVIILKNKNLQSFKKLVNLKKILELAEKISHEKKKIFLTKIYTKNAFDGENEFYHQDFAYRTKTGLKASSYMQCFIALEDHNIEGGCLKVFEGSNKLGLIKHYQVMCRSGVSKLTIPAQKLKNISKKNKLRNVKLKAGACIFFTYLTIHGSSSNASPNDQPRIVVQMHSKNEDISKKNNLKFWKARSLSEVTVLKKMIDSKKNRFKKTIN